MITEQIQPIIRFKLPDYVSCKTLGRYETKYNGFTKRNDFFIYVGVKRIIKYCIDSVNRGWDLTFDQIFSHVISHEYIHFIIYTQLGSVECTCFDNKFGITPYNPKYVYSGVTHEGDPLYRLPKRHFYTKLINSIRNIIGMVKK